MAPRPRIVPAPPPAAEAWPYHKLRSASISVATLGKGDRRLEAETYLSSGFNIRGTIQSGKDWQPFGEIARVWMPGRLKGIQIGEAHGTPYLAATQVFDVRPIPRKWIALGRTDGAEDRFVKQGTIIVTRSGLVGRSTVATATHEKAILSDDLLRIYPVRDEDSGWIYAYLQAPQVRAMLTGSHYGHIIKHLETGHLSALPVPLIGDSLKHSFQRQFEEVVALRNKMFHLTQRAEALFEEALSPPTPPPAPNTTYSVSSSALAVKRRRFEASVHSPALSRIREHLATHGNGFSTLAEAGYEVWLPSRFKRIPAAEGPFLLDSADLFEVNPDLTKRIADGDFGDPHRGRIEEEWVLMARSGQSYGIIGTAVLATAAFEGHIISDHVMRIKPPRNADLQSGYVAIALSHPTLGRPLVKSLAYGSSIPAIDVEDISGFCVVRLNPDTERSINSLALAAASARAQADTIERTMASAAAQIIGSLNE